MVVLMINGKLTDATKISFSPLQTTHTFYQLFSTISHNMINQPEFSFSSPETHSVNTPFSLPNSQLLLADNHTDQDAVQLISKSPDPAHPSEIEQLGYDDTLSITALFLTVILIIMALFFSFRRHLQQPKESPERQLRLESTLLESTLPVKTTLEEETVETTTQSAITLHSSIQPPLPNHQSSIHSDLITLEQAVEQRVTRASQAHNILKKHALAAMAVGIVPVPLIDMTAIIAVQVNLLYRLARLYKLTFSPHLVKSLLTFLLSGILIGVESKPLSNLLKIIPIVGQVSGIVSMSVLGGATTYAVGKVFIEHFESGGTFLDADPQKMRQHFQQIYEEGKRFASSQ